jgi:hypothetical protein
MYTDNTLTPKEAVRLCALGTLSSSSMPYGALANSIRHFVSHVIGPSLDVMGQSIELLRYEGLADFIREDGDDDEQLVITSAGRDALKDLLTARIRMGATELNKLIIALKFRFLHTLDLADQQTQIQALSEFAENELVRLSELRRIHAGDEGHIVNWLDHEIEQAEKRVQWLLGFSTDK